LGMSFDPSHPFLRDKWVVREVARRYLPPRLSQKRKFGLPYNGFKRMRISPSYFAYSPIADLHGLSTQAMQLLVQKSPSALRLKLLHLDGWSRVCLYRFPADQVLSKLKQHVAPAFETQSDEFAKVTQVARA